MPDLSGPFDLGTFAQAQWYRDAGPATPSGVIGPPSATAAGGELGLTAAGFVLSLGLGRARVRGAAYERTGAAWSYTVPANTHATQARIDRLVLRRDLVAKTVTPTVLQGVPAATPVAPALTRVENGVWDLHLFRFTVPANSGTPLVIADERRWIDPTSGHMIRPRVKIETGAVPAPGVVPGVWTAATTGWTGDVGKTVGPFDVSATGRVTLTESGVYLIGGSASVGGLAGGTPYVIARVARNAAADVVGSAQAYHFYPPYQWRVVAPLTIMDAVAGEYFDLQIYHENASNRAMSGATLQCMQLSAA